MYPIDPGGSHPVDGVSLAGRMAKLRILLLIAWEQ